jgi:cobalamin biosynthesis Mg chelatase CobN
MNKYLKVLVGVVLSLFLLTSTAFVMVADAKGSRGGGFRSGGFRSAPKATRTIKTVKPSKPKVTKPKVAKRPSSSTKKVTTTKRTVGGKTYSKTGNVVDGNYKPRFSGGYTPPAGSVVYYRESSMLDWLPLYFIMTHGQHREAVVVEKGKDGAPDKETVVKEEGTDSMYVINWIVTILFGLGLIGLVYWLITRKFKK